jgi:hypothetical protein
MPRHWRRNQYRRAQKASKEDRFLWALRLHTFGNESNLQAIFCNLRRFEPDAEVLCVSTGPEAATATHHVKAIPVAEQFFESWGRETDRLLGSR